MKSSRILLIGALAFLGFKAINTANSLNKIQFAVKGIDFDAIKLSSIGIVMEIYNPSDLDIKIQSGLLNVFINKVQIGTIAMENTFVKSGFNTVKYTINYSFLSIITSLKALAKKTMQLEIIGSVNILNTSIPINNSFTLDVPFTK